MINVIPFVLLLAGLAAIEVALWMIYSPLALLLAGVLFVGSALGLAAILGAAKRSP